MAIKFGDLFASNDIINNPKLEEFLNKTRDVAETFGKKSAEHLEISRKKVECLDAKTKLARLYEKFGRLQYDVYIGEPAQQSDIEELADMIALTKEKIESLTVEIETAKAQFNDAVNSATKKTRDAFHKEFDKMNKNEVTVSAEEVEVTEAKSEEQ